MHAQVDPIDRLDHAAVGEEVRLQALHVEDWRRMFGLHFELCGFRMSRK